ncbi:energy transducer TonB [Acetobacter cerevisiae]|uniref:Energy transducer TonB n=1 Tax=Acetobacter cerevisiae TaxID=178900 RepID=A0A149QGG2_9PROT|nr:energy transducer TonB [Acetobacter cerevisiae]KXU96333.1 energy transducer TonB [Acetobacter cerevisiae]GBQ05734.1 TonB periplasmic protein [Acetobacter cerevisiae DSM 14362]
MSATLTDGSGSVSTRSGAFAVWRAEQIRRARKDERRRWGVSLLVVLVVTGGVVGAVLRLPAAADVPVSEPPPAAIAIDLAPEPVSTPAPVSDVPPGPQQTLSTPDPAPEDPPKVSAPPSPAPNPPVPVPKPEKLHKVVKKSKPAPVLKKPVPDKTPPADQTTATPAAEAPPALNQAAPASGASSSHASQSPATWQGALLARLERYKRYPAEAMADHQEGVPMLHFSMDRHGHVLSARIQRGSGHTLLDKEALALVRRAEPLPSPPDSVAGDPVVLTVPIEFYMEQEKH